MLKYQRLARGETVTIPGLKDQGMEALSDTRELESCREVSVFGEMAVQHGRAAENQEVLSRLLQAG